MSEMATDLRVPLRRDDHGVLRIGATRVTLDSVMSAWNQGATPEEVALRFPVLDVRDVYAVCAWALANHDAVDAYLVSRRAQGDDLRQAIEERLGLAGLRDRLLARRG